MMGCQQASSLPYVFEHSYWPMVRAIHGDRTTLQMTPKNPNFSARKEVATPIFVTDTFIPPTPSTLAIVNTFEIYNRLSFSASSPEAERWGPEARQWALDLQDQGATLVEAVEGAKRAVAAGLPTKSHKTSCRRKRSDHRKDCRSTLGNRSAGGNPARLLGSQLETSIVESEKRRPICKPRRKTTRAEEKVARRASRGGAPAGYIMTGEPLKETKEQEFQRATAAAEEEAQGEAEFHDGPRTRSRRARP